MVINPVLDKKGNGAKQGFQGLSAIEKYYLGTERQRYQDHFKKNKHGSNNNQLMFFMYQINKLVLSV